MTTPYQQLDELALFRPRWDGEDALVIDPAIIAAARSFLEQLPDDLSKPLVMPCPAGTLQFEWESMPQPGQRYLELEFETPTTIHYLRQDSEGDLDEEDVFDIEDIDRAVSLIRWFEVNKLKEMQ